MIKSAEGRAGLLHKITKPTAWRGGAHILKEEQDARLLDRCEAKREEWAKQWLCGEGVQNVEALENEELRKLEEALPRLKECELDKMSRLYKGKRGVERDAFHPKVPLDLTKETRGEIVVLLEKVEQSGTWPKQVCTTMFFLIPKIVTSEKPIALMPTLIRWWQALRTAFNGRSRAWKWWKISSQDHTRRLLGRKRQIIPGMA